MDFLSSRMQWTVHSNDQAIQINSSFLNSFFESYGFFNGSVTGFLAKDGRFGEVLQNFNGSIVSQFTWNGWVVEVERLVLIEKLFQLLHGFNCHRWVLWESGREGSWCGSWPIALHASNHVTAINEGKTLDKAVPVNAGSCIECNPLCLVRVLVGGEGDILNMPGVLLQTNVAELSHPQSLDSKLKVRDALWISLDELILCGDKSLSPHVGPLGIWIRLLRILELDLLRLIHVLALVEPAHLD